MGQVRGRLREGDKQENRERETERMGEGGQMEKEISEETDREDLEGQVERDK